MASIAGELLGEAVDDISAVLSEQVSEPVAV
jgi:hypothetical protein